VPLPSDAEAQAFLETAVSLGILFFDTAPSYGSSERRLAAFIRQLPRAALPELTIATKCGEHWDESSGTPYVDHSYDALARSIDRSLSLLPSVHLLQIHKSTVAVVRDPGVRRALEYATRCGVRELGVSATDVETAALALADPLFSTIQIFYNAGNPKVEEVLDLAARAGKRVLVNRPFGMGALLYDGDGHHRGEPAMVDAFRFVLGRKFDGVVLTGTRSSEHLRENVAAFECARIRARA
jgi:aryl-alcohol dehydrogenase-like predicted oxidoreductase